jgi:hypothetical protein
MQSRDFSNQGFTQAQVEAELEMSRGSNKTRTRFEVLDYNLNKIRDLHGVLAGTISVDSTAQVIRTAQFTIREVASGITDYHDMVLGDKPVAYWELGSSDALYASLVYGAGGQYYIGAPVPLAAAAYVFQVGDYLEYDIFWEGNQQFISVDLHYSTGGGGYLGSLASDQNGLNNQPSTDLSSYASGIWYHRKVAIPSGFVGDSVNGWVITSSEAASGTYAAQVRNIQITNGSGTQRAQLWMGGQPIPTFTAITTPSGTSSFTVTQRAVDSTGDGNDGAYINSSNGNAAGLLPGVADTALTCSGASGGAVSVPNNSDLSPTTGVTVEAWVSVSSLTPSLQCVVGKYDGGLGLQQYTIKITSAGVVRFGIEISGLEVNLLSPASLLVAGQAYHIVCTYNGNTMAIYVNGILVASQTQTGSVASGTGTLTLGDQQTGGNPLTGTIDEVSIYNYALSPTQVRLHWDAGNGTTSEINDGSDRLKAYVGLWMPFQRYLQYYGEFNTSGNLESWTGTNFSSLAISGPNVVSGNLNGTLLGTSNSTAPSISKNVIAFSPTTFPNVEVRMRISASGSPTDSVTLRWLNPGQTTFTSSQQIVVSITDNGFFNTLLFQGLTGSSIIALQLLCGTQSGATVEIDYIRPTEAWPNSLGGTWIEWPMGIFLPNTTARTGDATGVTRSVDGYDLLQILVDDATTAAYVINATTASPGTIHSLAAGSSGNPNGAYRTVVTFLSAFGETTPGGEVDITVTNDQILWTNIPTGPPGCTGRNLYRTVAGGGANTEKLVTTISDNVTTSFTDNVADGSLGVSVPITNTYGATYIQAVTAILAAHSLTYNVVTDSLARSLPSDLSWAAGTSWLSVISDLLTAINYNPLYVDEVGVFHVTPLVQPVSRAAEYTYNASQSGVSIVSTPFQLTQDFFEVPNLVLTSQQSASTKGSAAPVYQAVDQNLNILSSTSYYQRGNRNIVAVLQEDPADQNSLTQFTSNALNAASNTALSVQFVGPFFPHSYNDVYGVIFPQMALNGNYNESQWSFDFTQEGGPMTHNATQAVSTAAAT